MLSLFSTVAKGAFELIKGYMERKQQTQAVKAEGEVLLKRATYASRARQREMEILQAGNYDTMAQRQKRYTPADEIIMAFFQTIIIMAFLPWTQQYVAEGFRILKNEVPIWFILLYVGIVASTMGLRWLVEMFAPVFARLGGLKPATEKTVHKDPDTGDVKVTEKKVTDEVNKNNYAERYDDLLERYNLKE